MTDTFHVKTVLKGNAKSVVHRSDCGMCKHGKGLHETKGGKSSKWLGPFETRVQAQKAAKERKPKSLLGDCGTCRPELKKRP